jgi:hypothetical protein
MCRRSRRPILAVAIVLGLALTGCSSDATPAPTTVPSVTGTWTGELSVQGTSAMMTWTLTESGTDVTGPVFVVLPTGVVLLNGAFSGTLSGTTLAYTIAVSPGGFPSQPECSGQLAGTVTVTSLTASAVTLVGSYSATSVTCQTLFSGGSFTLTRGLSQ